MAKMEIEFELTGLKLKVKTDGEDASSSNKVADLQRQVQSLVNTISSLTQGAGSPALPAPQQPQNGIVNAGQTLIEAQAEPASSNGARGKKTGGRKSSVRQPAEAIDFKHDAEKYGFPKQEWTTAQKAMWLLYVLSQGASMNECSAPVLAATFNKHFKTFGSVHKANIHRDLGKEKGKSGWVNSDATQDPQKWFLLEEGKKGIIALIQESKAPAA